MDSNIRLRLPHEMTMEELEEAEPHLWTEDEWKAVCKKLDPTLTDARYKEMWDAFQAKKAMGAFQAPPQ